MHRQAWDLLSTLQLSGLYPCNPFVQLLWHGPGTAGSAGQGAE